MEKSPVSRPHPDLAGYLELRKQEYMALYDRWANDPQPYDWPPPHWPSQKCMLNWLPHELSLLVFRYLYQADLFHLALTCRHSADLAIPVLYRRDVAEFDCLSLRWACTFGLLETLDRVLHYGVSVNHRFEHDTAVDCAWVIRDSVFHECLFNTPLKLAIFTDDAVLVRTLCERGADVNAPDSYSTNCTAYRLEALYPLHRAMDILPGVQPGNPRIVQVLLDAGADPNQYTSCAWPFYAYPDSVCELPLGLAMQSTVPAETVRLLLEHGADPLLKGQYGGCQVVERYGSGPDLSSPSIPTRIKNVYPGGLCGELTPLMTYFVSSDPDTWSSDEEKVRLLLQHGAACDAHLIVTKLASDQDSLWFDPTRTPDLFRIFASSLCEKPGLDMVSFSQREISLFLAVIRLTDRWITHHSIIHGLGHRATDFLQITSNLLRRMGEACGTDSESLLSRDLTIVDTKDSSSNYDPGWDTSDPTALRWLCLPFRFLGSATLITPLLQHGAYMNRTDSEGMTPLHFAVMFASGDRVRPLVEFLGGPEVSGLAVDARDIVGWTPLHFACFFGLSTQLDEQVRAARLLLGNGADIHAQTIGGWTPLALAVKNGNLGLVRFLLGQGGHRKDMFGPPGHESLRAKMFFCKCLEHATSDWEQWGVSERFSRRVNGLRRFAAAAGGGDDELVCAPPVPLPLPRQKPKVRATIASLRAANILYEHETLSLLNPFIRNSPALDSWADLVRNNVDEYSDQVLHNLTPHNMTVARQAQFCSRDGIYYDQPPTLGIQCVRMCHIRDDND
ncbi:putative ankyrin [Triangularia setosa]|uniref:protein S-acyltransferase n=1 Tax=Triangularia setosa TaxID=2587417 RepID=A0AAN6WC42_9PEZI|nr:putative ankyrin [Podospora setosa]